MSDSARQAAALKAELEALKAEITPPPSSSSNQGMSDSARQVAALKAELDALKASPVPSPSSNRGMSDSARQAEALKAELEALKASPVPSPSSSSNQGMSDSARQMEALKAELDALKASPVPSSSSSNQGMSDSARQVAALKAELDALKATPVPSSSSSNQGMSDSARQVAALKAELDALKAAPVPSPSSSNQGMSDSARQVAALKAELDALKATPAPSSSSSNQGMSDSARQVAALKAELEALRKPPSAGNPAVISASARQLAELQAEMAKLKEKKKSEPTESEKRLAALEKELADLRDGRLPSSGKSETASEKQLRDLQEQMAEMEVQLGAPEPSESEDSDLLAAKRELEDLRDKVLLSHKAHEARARELDRLKKIPTESESDLIRRRDDLREELGRIQRGLDLCILLDATYSMDTWIKECQAKIMEMFKASLELAQGGIVRIAFVAYRDHRDAKRFEFSDFKEREELEQLKKSINDVVHSGGGDYPEDIAGAFEVCSKFAWKSTTRLIFHIADAPCHGRRYHPYKDDYPDGDPHGLNPEDFIQYFARNRIDYYFYKLDNGCDQMLPIFEKAYRATTKKGTFKVFDSSENHDPKDLLPAVIASITSSCRAYV